MSNSSWPLTGPISSTLSLFTFFAEGPELVGVSFGPRFDMSSVSRTQPPKLPAAHPRDDGHFYARDSNKMATRS